MRESNKGRIALLILTLMLVSLLSLTVTPETVSSQTDEPEVSVTEFDRMFYEIKYYQKFFINMITWKMGRAEWKVYCEVYKFRNDPNYLAIFLEHWKATWKGDPAKEIKCVIKPYWSGTYKNHYMVVDSNYEPEGFWKDGGTTTFTITFRKGIVQFSLGVQSGSQYKIVVDFGYGWMQWTHTRTFWGQFWGKNIFTSLGYLKWSAIIGTDGYSSTLNLYVEIKLGNPYNGQTSTWTWENIYTYNPA